MFLVVILYALLAATFLLAKVSVNYADPFFLIGFRMVVAGIILLTMYSLKRRYKKITPSALGLLIGLIFFHIYFSFVPEFWALQYITSIKVNIMYSITPFITALLAYFLHKERLSGYKVAGICIGFIGLLPVLMGRGDQIAWSELFSLSLPDTMLLFSIISGAYAWFIIKKLMDQGYSLLFMNGFSMFWGGILSLITWKVASSYSLAQSVIYNWPYFLMTVSSLILLSNLIVYNLYAKLVQRYSLTLIAFAGFLCPVFGAFYGKIFLGESLYWYHAFALACITAGLYCFYRDSKNPIKIHELENI